jgi:hypothetical protein
MEIEWLKEVHDLIRKGLLEELGDGKVHRLAFLANESLRELEESRLEADALRSAADRMGEEIRELREKGREMCDNHDDMCPRNPPGPIDESDGCPVEPISCGQCWREYGEVFYREGDK